MSNHPYGMGDHRPYLTWAGGITLALATGYSIHPLVGVLCGGLWVAGWLWRFHQRDEASAGPLFRVVRHQVIEIPLLYKSALAEVVHLGLGRRTALYADHKDQLLQLIAAQQTQWDAEWSRQCLNQAGTGSTKPPPPPAPQVQLDGWRYPLGLGNEGSQAKPQPPAANNLAPLPGVMLARFWVAGTGFHLQAEECPLLEPGTALELQPEPDNEHDSFAVAVWHQGLQLGYIPREDNKAISRLLLAGKPLTCRLSSLAANKAPWRMYEAEIYQLNPP